MLDIISRIYPQNITRSLTMKMFFIFLAISLVGIILISIVVWTLILAQFNEFTDPNNEDAIVEQLKEYYAEEQGWERVGESEIDTRLTLEVGNTFLLGKEGNTVLLPAGTNLEEAAWWQQQIQSEISLMVDGEEIGRLVKEPIGREFTENVKTTLAVSALGAFIFAFLLSRIISYTLTSPVRDLTAASHAIAKGGVAPLVPIRTNDELGQLARAFNTMSQEVEKTREMRRQLSADIAHDLRTPLGLIVGHAEALRDGVLPPSAETFDIIYDEALRINRLVLDLRTITMAETGMLELERAAVYPHALLSHTVIAHQNAAQNRGVDLSMVCAKTMPDIQIDEAKMAQVLDNLVSNALRYTPSGGWVKLTAQATASQLAITVSDNGKGIAADDLEHIFDRFYRGDKARSRTQGGSGLGLAIAQSIVQQHNGTISASSPPQAGTTFHIELPYHNNDNDPI